MLVNLMREEIRVSGETLEIFRISMLYRVHLAVGGSLGKVVAVTDLIFLNLIFGV